MPKQNTPETSQASYVAPEEPKAPITTPEAEKQPASPQGAPPAATLGSTLTDADKERIQKLVAAAGGRKFGLNRLPDGAFRLDVTIPVEIAAALESQAECAGESLEDYIQRTVVEALQAYTWAAAT